MSTAHPSVTLLLTGAPAAAAHARACAACRAVMALATPVAAASDPERDLDDLPVVDRGLYVGWQELEDGGMGRTYRARDRRLAREIAIKQVGDGGGDPALAAALRQRFEVEARLTARLQHPAIVGVHEAGRFADGEPFYAMALVRGASLDVELERRPELADRLALLPHVTAVCEAIAYAHREGIVHRDLKPQNVMIGPFGETVVIDWGLARDLAAKGDEPSTAPFRDRPEDGLTRAGLGTPQYMAPEQATGEGATPAMDVYALGATLYQLLAGVPPYGRHADGVRVALHRGPPRPLAELAPAAPPELIDIVGRAMAREPRARFATVRELADELRRFQTGQLLHSRRYTLREVLARFVRRHRLAVAIGAAALLVVAAIGAIAIQRVARERTRAVAGERGAQRELRRARGITASQLAPQPARRLEALELAVAAVAPVADEPPPAEAVAGLADALARGPALVVLPGHTGSGHDLAFDAAGRRLATLGDDGFVRLWDARTGAPRARHRVAIARPYAMAFAGDELVITGFDAAFERWDVELDRSVRIADGEAAIPHAVVTARDVVSGSNSGTLVAWHGDRAAARVELGVGLTFIEGGPGGEIAAALIDGSVAVWSGDRRTVRRHRGHRGQLMALGFDAGGHLLSGASDGAVRWWTDDRTSIVIHAEPPGLGIYGLRMAPDRTRMAIKHGGVTMVTLAADGRVAQAIALPSAPGPRHAFADDGRVATTNALQVSISDLDGAPLLELDPGQILQTPSVALLPAGDRLVTSDKRGQTWLWDTRLGAEVGMLPGHASELVAVAVSPGGAQLLTAALDGRVATIDLASGRVAAAHAGGVELAGAAWLAGGQRRVWWDVDGAVELIDGGGGTVARWPGGAADVAVERDGVAAWLATDDGRVVALTDGGGHDVVTGLGPLARIAVAGDRVAVGGADGSVTLLEGGRRTVLRPPGDGGAVATLAFAPGGARLAAGWSGGPTRVYQVHERALAFEADGAPLGWSPDGRHLAITVAAGGVALHDASSGGAAVVFAHPGVVLAVALSADGSTLVSGGLDGTVQVWDAGTGALRLRYDPDLGAVTALAVSPAGDLVVAGYHRGAVRAWPLTLAGARARACATLAELGRPVVHAAYCG